VADLVMNPKASEPRSQQNRPSAGDPLTVARNAAGELELRLDRSPSYHLSDGTASPNWLYAHSPVYEPWSPQSQQSPTYSPLSPPMRGPPSPQYNASNSNNAAGPSRNMAGPSSTTATRFHASYHRYNSNNNSGEGGSGSQSHSHVPPLFPRWRRGGRF